MYLDLVDINDLSAKIKQFANGEITDIKWNGSKLVKKPFPNTEFRLIKRDQRGHIFIEVYMSIADNADLMNHCCCFYINSEIGQLDAFARGLSRFYEADIDTELRLDD